MRITWEQPEPYAMVTGWRCPSDVETTIRIRPNEKLIGWMWGVGESIQTIQITPESKLLKVTNSYRIPIGGKLIIEAE